MASRFTKFALGAAATTAAGVLAARRLAEIRESHLDRWASADGDEAADALRFPEGEPFRVTTSDGAELVGVDVAGDGPAVLLVHGYIGTRGHWGPVALALAAAGHRVLAYEQRGHGDSTVGDAGFTMTALGNDMRAVLEHLDLRDVTVAGHSMGGMALQSYLANHPESAKHRVRLAVLTATAAGPDSRPALLVRAAPAFLGSPMLDTILGEPRKGAFHLRSVVGTEVRLSHLEATRRTLIETRPTTRVGAYRMLAGFDLRPWLGAIEVPTIIVAGTHDELCPLAQSHELDELIDHAELHVFEDAGHMLPFERTDALTELIVRSIEKVDADGRPLPASVTLAG